MSRYLVAVSGGVDSVVLLDKLVREAAYELIVAHVDHGIRPDSADDARFVGAIARSYALPYVSTQLELGEHASEEQARQARYEFLYTQAHNYEATIVTAHHLDDLVETIVINLTRGTGHRGLAVLRREGTYRPLLAHPKSWVYDYALKHHLEWVEDSTNSDTRYLRNRIRYKSRALSSRIKNDVLRLRARQVDLECAIAEEATRLIAAPYRRYLFLTVEPQVADELFIAVCKKEAVMVPIREQRTRAILAIKTARAGKSVQIGDGITLVFTATHFIVRTS